MARQAGTLRPERLQGLQPDRQGPAGGEDRLSSWASPAHVEAAPAGAWAGSPAEAAIVREDCHDRVIAAALPVHGSLFGEGLGYWNGGWNSKQTCAEQRDAGLLRQEGRGGIKVVGEMGNFPVLFLIFCFCMFAVPILMIYGIGRDPQVRYWISDSVWWLVLALPVLYVACAILQASFGPSRRAMVLCTAGSCALLLGLADYVLLEAQTTGGNLAQWSCDTFPQKRAIQLQWAAAQAFYSGCMVNTAAATGSNLASVVGTYRIEECTGYQEQLKSFPAWPYLQSLEEEHHCAGWCVKGQALWTVQPVNDACAAAVADVMESRVTWRMSQVIVYSLLSLGLVTMMLIAANPALRAAGH